MNPTMPSSRVVICGGGRAVSPSLIHTLAQHGYTVETHITTNGLEKVRKPLILPNHGVTAYDVLNANDLLDIVKCRPNFNKPSKDTPLEFELYIKLLKDRRSNRHFKMMRRFT